MFWDTDLFVFILPIVHELLSCVHGIYFIKVGKFFAIISSYFFLFFPLSCPLGVPLYSCWCPTGLWDSTFFFFCPSFHCWLFFFCWPGFHIHWFFSSAFSNLLMPFSEILCYRYWSFWLQNSLWFSFIISLFYQGSVFVDCHHVSLYVLNMVFYFLSIFTIPALKSLSAKSNF